ncbi:hypothetical protein LDENG_00135560 [Lucifuga dentata]|nr:hypothetical protein LDENG_00135560 [Lucifuga dentata]
MFGPAPYPFVVGLSARALSGGRTRYCMAVVSSLKPLAKMQRWVVVCLALQSFQVITAYMGAKDNNIWPDQSQLCPFTQGVPCSDRKYCCREGHHCTADSRSCIKNESVAEVANAECSEESTYCEPADWGSDWGWRCCPRPQAVCCEDKIHCCPEGSTCDIKQFKCIFSPTEKAIPMWDELPAWKRGEWVTGEVVFCDDTMACPDQTICCRNIEGGWSCCPLPEAVCCEDLQHCCPHGKRCNMAAGTCDDPFSSLPWVEKVPTIPRQHAEAGNVPCDWRHCCPDQTTCCKTVSGDWACCLLPQAVCCEDHIHCCPAGYTCNLAAQTCDSMTGSVPMKEKVPAFTSMSSTETPAKSLTGIQQTEKQVEEDKEEMKADETKKEEEEGKEETGRIQCDSRTSCPRDSTCCFMPSFKIWGCCSLPQAVCCSDGLHCCPFSYKCDLSTTSCIKGEVVIPWYTKLPATTSIQAEPSSVECDTRHRCPDQSTCCRLITGDWSCCPLQQAVCCSDNKHCCPQGYSCNLAIQSCEKLIMQQLETMLLTPVFMLDSQPQPDGLKEKKIKCDDQTSCEDDQTCCKISATIWGCCPAPNAVCCDDMKHCCPAGFTCTATGSCIQNSGLRWDNGQIL